MLFVIIGLVKGEGRDVKGGGGGGGGGSAPLSTFRGNTSLVPRLPPLARNYCVTFKLALAIIARKGGSLGTRLGKHCTTYFS